MELLKIIGLTFFSRARARAYIVARACLLGRQACLPAGRYEKLHKRIVIAIVFVVSCFAALGAADQDANFVRGFDTKIHAVRLNHNPEEATRRTMKFAGACAWIKRTATAAPLVGSENSTLDLSIKSTRGVVLLQGLSEHASPKTLYSVLLSPYKNYPTSIPSETTMLPGSRHALAVTLAAQITGTGDLKLQKGDRLTIHADGQLYTYALPAATIPDGGFLRLYLGTDDTLYVDAALKHPFHAGACGRSKP